MNKKEQILTASTNALEIMYNGDKVDAVQQFIIKFEKEESFVEIDKVFFNYDTRFVKLACCGLNYIGTFEIRHFAEYPFNKKEKLRMILTVELLEYEQKMNTDSFIIAERMKFKIVKYKEIDYVHNECSVPQDELGAVRKMLEEHEKND